MCKFMITECIIETISPQNHLGNGCHFESPIVRRNWLNNDGSFSYAPFSGFAGSDSFEYDLTDADNESSSNALSL